MVLLIIIPFLNGYFIGNIPNIFRQSHNGKYIEIAGNWMLAMLAVLAWYHNDVFQRAHFQSERQDPSGNGTAQHD